jgi:hypothetical protein
MIEPSQFKAILLGAVNDATDVEPYGDGHLVNLPLQFPDGDAVSIYVCAYGDGYRLSDRGEVAMRLDMAGVPDSPAMQEAWQHVTGGRYTVNPEADVITGWVPADELGAGLLEVGQVVMRADQLRLVTPPQVQGPRFDRKVVTRLRNEMPRGAKVQERYPVRLTSGRERRSTAAVIIGINEPLVVQALSDGAKQAREQSVERAIYMFEHATDVDRVHRLAIVGGRPGDWDGRLLGELGDTTEYLFFESTDFDINLAGRVHATA